MKNAFVFLPFLLTSGPALAWDKIMDCDNGLGVIDMEVSGVEVGKFQLVIRHPQAVTYLAQAGAFPYAQINERGEAVLPLDYNTNATSFELIGLSDAYRDNGRVQYVKPIGTQLVFESFRTSQPTGGLFVQHEKVADWIFNSCK